MVLRRLDIGGAERVAADIATALAQAGASVVIATFAQRQGTARIWFENAGRIAVLGKALSLDTLIQEDQSDTLVLCGPSPAYRDLPLIKAAHPGLRVVTFMFNARQLVAEHRLHAPFIDVVIAESAAAAGALVGDDRAMVPVRIVSSGVDVTRLLGRARPLRPAGLVNVGFVGRFDRTKNPEAFIRLAKRCRSLPVRWTMMGPKPFWFRIPSFVDYLGALTGEPKEEMIDQLDVLVVPSRHDGRPLIIHEAHARGIAVIASAVGAIPDLISDDENGLLVDAGDDDELAQVLQRLVFDSELRARLGAAARVRVPEQGDMGRALPLYLSAVSGDYPVD